MASIVLVHGAWSRAALWGDVPARLREAGHAVVAVDLPEPDSERPVGLADCADAVIDALPAGACILVGHSLGGMVISAVAERVPERLARLVYVAAFLPRDGDSLLALKRREGHTIGAAIRPGPIPGTTVLDPDLAGPFLFQDLDAARQASALGLLRPQANAVQTDPVHLTDGRFGAVPRDYVLCRQDRTITPDLQRAMARETPCRRLVELESGHFPQLSCPEELVRVVLGESDPADMRRN